jgi:hypothetical protein
MIALLNSPGGASAALEKRARFDFVIIHPDQAALGETFVLGSACKNTQKQTSIFDPALFDMAMHPASLREWGISE